MLIVPACVLVKGFNYLSYLDKETVLFTVGTIDPYYGNLK